MSSVASFLVRWRVRLGYLTGAAVLWFARPEPRWIIAGALLGAVGVVLRGWAAGYLRKQEELAVAGPYAYTRNPLYLGSAVLLCGLGLATWSWISAGLAVAYFSIFYTAVMRREEEEMQRKFGAVYDEYARSVPLFFPRWSAHRTEAGDFPFSWQLFLKNREYQTAAGYLFVLAVLVIAWAYRLA